MCYLCTCKQAFVPPSTPFSMRCSGTAFHIYPSKHFHSLPKILVKRDAKTTFLCPDSWQRMPQYLSHFARSGSVYPCDMHCRFGLFLFQIPSNHSPKLPLLQCKTATFGMQNAPFWNAKRTVLECKMHRFALQNLHEKELICTSTGGFFVGNRGKFCV